MQAFTQRRKALCLMAGTWCLDPDETLSEGQEHEISRVYEMYPHLNDDAFVAQNLETWKA